jgi:urease beta subunit
MVAFSAIIKQFAEQGEKTGWTYIEIPAGIAVKIKPGNKKTFRVKGKLDSYQIKAVALMPMGGGNFIMALNAEMRKAIKKRKGATIQVQLQEDKEKLQPSVELLDCLADEPKAKAYFDSLTYGHKNYFSKWIESAKTEPTKTKRIAQAIDALSRQMDFGSMLRSLKEDRQKLK